MLGPEAHSEVNVVYSSPLIRIRWGVGALIIVFEQPTGRLFAVLQKTLNTCPSKWVAANGKVSMSVGSNITGNNF